MNESRPRITLLGIGNPLCRDDGIGIYAIQEIQTSGSYAGVDIIDGGTSPDLLSLVDANIDKLIIVDALRGGGEPGSVYRLEIDESHMADDIPASLHGLGVLDHLKMMKKLGIEPHKVVIIGVEPLDTSHGLQLSKEIQSRIPDIMVAIEEEIGDNLLK